MHPSSEMADGIFDDIVTSYSNRDIDLNSASATRTLNFEFSTGKKKQSPITIFTCTNPWLTCWHIKEWIVDPFCQPDLAVPGIVRMDTLDLSLISPQNTQGEGRIKGKESYFVLFEGAACLDGSAQTYTIMTIIIQGDSRARWFYSLLNPTSLLTHLDSNGMIHLRKHLRHDDTATMKYHASLTTYLRETFPKAIHVPHHPDYLNAQKMTDYCPPILNPETALQRLLSHEKIYFAHRDPNKHHRDLSDDRYLLQLHPAEREAASLTDLSCAEYMMTKRIFFDAFWTELYRFEDRIGPVAQGSRRNGRHAPPRDTPMAVTPASAPAAAHQYGTRHRNATPLDQRHQTSATEMTATPEPAAIAKPTLTSAKDNMKNKVRSRTAHQKWLEDNFEKIKTTQAKLLVFAWEELGFLDEERFLPLLHAGGMLEEIGWQEGGEEAEV